MVTLVDLENLFKKYLEENRFECADALYLYAVLGKEKVSQTLWLRYGTIAPLASVFSDLEKLGVKDLWELTQDVGTRIRDAIVEIFEHMCLGELVKRVEGRVKRLSPLARGFLYLAMKFKGKTLWGELLAPLCELIFQLRADEKLLKRSFEELVAYHIFQHTDPDYAIPTFFDKLVPVLEKVLPDVEIKVTWPESK
ncbi:MAG: hypothetical protein QXZ06_07955 [Candidatus Jordarchaeales archaeon]